MILQEATLEGVSVSMSGIEPGSFALTTVVTLCDAIVAHAEAVSAKDTFVKEAGRRADAAHRLMNSLARETFPDGHPSLGRVVQIIYEIEVSARKRRESSKWSKLLALTQSDISKACKYRESFQQLFAILDRALQELMSAVQVDSDSNLTKLSAGFQEEAAKLNEEFSTAAAAAGEHAASQGEVLEALGDQSASLEVLLEASRERANALAEMESHLDSALGSLKADLAAGMRSAQATAKAAAAVAEAMQEHGSSRGGRGAADHVDTIVAALDANILEHVVPELLDALVAEGVQTSLTRSWQERQAVLLQALFVLAHFIKFLHNVLRAPFLSRPRTVVLFIVHCPA
jgi:hypothetical protein